MKADTVTATELAVLQLLWEQGEVTSSEVAEALYEEVSDPKRASAQKLLDRLVWKGCVERDRSGRPHRFRAALSREEFASQHVQALADKLYGGSMCPVLTSLVQSKGISKKELVELRELIDQMAKPAQRRVSKRKA